jgi:hypothetical protein
MLAVTAQGQQLRRLPFRIAVDRICTKGAANMSPARLSSADLASLNTEELMALFGTLEAPEVAEMDGEYAASLLQQPSLAATLLGYVNLYNPLLSGSWLCKAFRPVSALEGRGYNGFRHFGRIVQRFPMQTLVAASRYDGRPAYQLVYRAYHSVCGEIHMVDEVRRVAPGVYLGIGTWGFSTAQRLVPLPFLLTGPVAAYRGDVGRARAGFNLSCEIPALNQH